MKYVILIFAFIFFGNPEQPLAGPFLICDPQAGVEYYKLTGPAWVPLTFPAQPDGSIRMDIANSLVGNNSLTAAACRNDVIWGELCSSTVPFSFSRPSPSANPQNLGLSKQ